MVVVVEKDLGVAEREGEEEIVGKNAENIREKRRG